MGKEIIVVAPPEFRQLKGPNYRHFFSRESKIIKETGKLLNQVKQDFLSEEVFKKFMHNIEDQNDGSDNGFLIDLNIDGYFPLERRINRYRGNKNIEIRKIFFAKKTSLLPEYLANPIKEGELAIDKNLYELKVPSGKKDNSYLIPVLEPDGSISRLLRLNKDRK